MKFSLAGASQRLPYLALVAAIAAVTPVAPASAQSGLSPVASEGASCPAGWSYAPAVNSRINTETCYPTGSNAREVYRRKGGEACRAGYNTGTLWCEKAAAVYVQKGTTDPLTKQSKADRCPTGWFTTGDGLTCVTALTQPTSSRAKTGKACAAGEVDEWGKWCTSNYGAINAGQIRSAALRDYNTMYAQNRGVVVATFAGNDLDEKLLTPVHRKLFGDAPVRDEPEAAVSTAASRSADLPQKSCDTEVAQGAAIGGAVAGRKGQAMGALAGAALGAAKKKKGC